MVSNTNSITPNLPLALSPPTPAGLTSIYELCRKIYPDQPNPLQVTALLKFWLGGPDPLDYVSIYRNPGKSDENIPPHWHYISLGLSDLHGDGRVHRPAQSPDSNSGFGFELTFRLICESDDTTPPTWPSEMMQSLAKYVFHQRHPFQIGDHISYHCSLDRSESMIRHMLIAADSQLATLQTPFGSVDFFQIVGINNIELDLAQKWNGCGILRIMKRFPSLGGHWHITNMRRCEDILNVDVSIRDEINEGFHKEGSNLSGVCGHCTWIEDDFTSDKKAIENDFIVNFRLQSQGMKNLNDSNISESIEIANIQPLIGVHLIFNYETGILLNIALKGRVLHGRHFTFDSKFDKKKITLVSSRVTGSVVSDDEPFVSQGSWLQVLITDSLAYQMLNTLQNESLFKNFSKPKTLHWQYYRLAITIVPDKT